jgi:AAA ATPase domain
VRRLPHRPAGRAVVSGAARASAHAQGVRCAPPPHRAAGPAGDEDRAVRGDLARHGGRQCGAHGGDLRAARRALGDDPRAPRFIQTVHRRGYRFVATIRSSPASHVGSIAAGPSPPSDPSLDVTADEPDRAPDVAPSRALVGREEEMRQLHACLRRALDGQCQVVFVTGEPGIGKTALVGAFPGAGRSVDAGLDRRGAVHRALWGG